MTDTDDDQATWDAMYGTPPAPEYTDEDEETYQALYGPVKHAPLSDEDQAIYDAIYDHSNNYSSNNPNQLN